jgi:phosphate transport system protein
MLRQLFSALSNARQIDEDFEKLGVMLEHDHWMFDRAVEVLERRIDAAAVQDALYERDQAVNGLEREIRTDLVRHLSVNPGRDVAACLTLMSIAKDAERIGDYCKGVFEVGRWYVEPFDDEVYQGPLATLRAEVSDLFAATQDVYRRGDKEAALAALERITAVKMQCKEIITALLSDAGSRDTAEMVAYSLLARHYKRVAAHLGNICTAMVSDVAGLDFAGGSHESPRDA